MKPVEKAKTQKLVSKIESGNFDENDVDSLFIKLRAYSDGFPIFKEISDFVAHNDLRDRGISNQSLETMYLRVKFFLEYDSPKKPLDITSPFPLWIKRLMILQVHKANEHTLKEKFNVTKQRLETRIDKGFVEDKKNKMAIYKENMLSAETFNAIKHVMSFISGNAPFNQDDMIKELIGVLRKNKLVFDEYRLLGIADKITICTLLLFHKAEFDFKGYKIGHSEISCEKHSISINTRFIDAEGKEVEHIESFGNLHINGCVTLKNNGKELSILHQLMSTNLDVEYWCSESLFYIEPITPEAPNYLCKKLN